MDCSDWGHTKQLKGEELSFIISLFNNSADFPLLVMSMMSSGYLLMLFVSVLISLFALDPIACVPVVMPLHSSCVIVFKLKGRSLNLPNHPCCPSDFPVIQAQFFQILPNYAELIQYDPL